MKILFLLPTLLLTACGTAGSLVQCVKGDSCASYAIITEGTTSGLKASFTGGANSCKVTTFGDISAWSVTYEGTKCTALLNGD